MTKIEKHQKWDREWMIWTALFWTLSWIVKIGGVWAAYELFFK